MKSIFNYIFEIAENFRGLSRTHEKPTISRIHINLNNNNNIDSLENYN